MGQGDACLITTPGGHRVLVDGGENKLAARYLAARYWDETVAGKDVHFDAIVVTHGDADHFDGLSTLVLDAVAEKRDRKRIRVSASRVFHNGLVKRGSTVPDRDRLGPAIDTGGRLFVPCSTTLAARRTPIDRFSVGRPLLRSYRLEPTRASAGWTIRALTRSTSSVT